MNLNEENLKDIIEYIERFGSVKDIRITNSAITVTPPLDNKVMEIEMNRANEYTIRFIMGETKEQLR